MRYVDFWERIGRRDGLEIGRVDSLREQLKIKFGDLPGWADERLNKADHDQLTQWTRAL